jgi:hypothetical protein
LTQLHFGWTRLGLICDTLDSYSVSFFDVLNGTDPTNINNLQPLAETEGGAAAGPYDVPRLDIAHAERIDLNNDSNATKNSLMAAIKAKDIKVIILLGQTAFVDGLLTYGLDRGIFGRGYQFILTDQPYVEEKMLRERERKRERERERGRNRCVCVCTCERVYMVIVEEMRDL